MAARALTGRARRTKESFNDRDSRCDAMEIDDVPARARAGVWFGARVQLAARRSGGAIAAAAALYAQAGFSWPLFALGFLAPDVAMLGYFVGPRIGAVVYNVAHTYALRCRSRCSASSPASPRFWRSR